MRTLDEYVEWVARSMGRNLRYDKINKITYQLIKSEKYKEALNELEEMIIEEDKTRWKEK